MSIITLLTDFGDIDEYVGVMKGVILSIASDATIVDLTHKIEPQDIHRAGWMLKAAYPYFPKGTVHMAVVDPGVGSDRKIVALKIDGHIFLAPDNGLLSVIWRDKKIEASVFVEERRNFLPDISSTFHGRDIFAPVAARLSRGLSLNRLGPAALHAELYSLSIETPSVCSQNRILGTIVSIDRFGNLTTNIDAEALNALREGRSKKRLIAKVGSGRIEGLHRSYCDVPEGQALMIIGSRGFLEIAVNRGSASQLFNIEAGGPIIVEMSD